MIRLHLDGPRLEGEEAHQPWTVAHMLAGAAIAARSCGTEHSRPLRYRIRSGIGVPTRELLTFSMFVRADDREKAIAVAPDIDSNYEPADIPDLNGSDYEDFIWEELLQAGGALHDMRMQPPLSAFKYEARRYVQPIHFEDFDGAQFERFVFAYKVRSEKWQSLEWYGQTGRDVGRDLGHPSERGTRSQEHQESSIVKNA